MERSVPQDAVSPDAVTSASHDSPDAVTPASHDAVPPASPGVVGSPGAASHHDVSPGSVPWYEEFFPGRGVLAPRAWYPVSDAARLSLNGSWRFRLSPTADAEDLSFTGPGYAAKDAGRWDTVTVPGHWVLQGHGAPAYTNVAYPFPLDPPRVPAENPTGDHLRVFALPDDWPRGGDTVLRFDGADSCARVWLNGTELGRFTGSRLPHEFAVGALLKPAGNVLAVRVHQWSSGSYLEDQDQWWLPGIFRDVTLLHRPEGAVGDFFVHAAYDAVRGAGTLRVDCAVPGRVTVPELGIDAATGEPVTVPAEPWTAETPRLYDAELATRGERVALRVGFRTVAVENGVLTVNGRRVLFRGVNRHEFHPRTGRAVDAATMRRDLLLMKQHNINAVRTAHYPPHPAFLDLCDELGLWVIDECDLETHGFGAVGWRGNPVADPRWTPALLDRAARMVERDKNHPSVVMWSLGNECGTGDGLAAMARWIRDRDPDRPLHYEGDPSCAHTDVYSRMYADHAEVEAIGRREDDGPAERRRLPFLLCEYGHAMGNGPGGLADYQRLFTTYERCQGGFVWEWIDHGLAHPAHGYAYGGDFGEEVHDGNFVCDGLLFPDRTPSPGLAEYKKVIEPVRISAGVTVPGTVAVANAHDFADLGALAFTWSYEADGVPLAAGPLTVPALAPGERAEIALPEPPVAPDGAETWWTVRAVLARDTAWAVWGHVVAWGQIPVRGRRALPRVAGAPPRQVDGALVLGPGTFDPATGALCALDGIGVTGPRLDVWRAPTDNDIGAPWQPELRCGPRWRELGLHRMRHRVDQVAWAGGALSVRTRVAPAATDLALRTVQRWTSDGERLRLTVAVTPEGDWPVPLPRLGIRFGLPAAFGQVRWFGGGPGEAYPDTRAAARIGRWRSTVDALQTPYVRPQENGARADVRWAELTGGGRGVRIEGEPAFWFTARRWTSEQLDAADHRPDLVAGDTVWVQVDHAQHGIGSQSCGPGVLPAYRLKAAPAAFSFVFSPLREECGGRGATE